METKIKNIWPPPGIWEVFGGYLPRTDSLKPNKKALWWQLHPSLEWRMQQHWQSTGGTWWDIQPGCETNLFPKGSFSTWVWRLHFRHRLKFRWIPDSLFEMLEDQWFLEGQLEKKMAHERLHWAQQCRIESRLFPRAWLLALGKQNPGSNPMPAAMNPALLHFESGLLYQTANTLECGIGFSGARLTWISDGSLWKEYPSENQLFGIERPGRIRLEYGWSARFRWLWEPRPDLQWEVQSRAFYGFSSDPTWSLEGEQKVQWQPFHRLAFSWGTRWNYQPLIYPNHQWLMEWSLGFLIGNPASAP